jgi:hypothetical protein
MSDDKMQRTFIVTPQGYIKRQDISLLHRDLSKKEDKKGIGQMNLIISQKVIQSLNRQYKHEKYVRPAESANSFNINCHIDRTCKRPSPPPLIIGVKNMDVENHVERDIWEEEPIKSLKKFMK